MRKRMINSQPGFTVLELTFAIVVIGVMMAIVLSTILGMLRFYNFASVIRQNQAAGRQVLDDIDRQVRFATLITPDDTAPNNSPVLCVADTKNQQVFRYDLVGPASAQSVQKTTLSYTGAAIPTNCNSGNPNLTPVGLPTIITPTTMHVKALTFTKTGGARIVSNPEATAVVTTLQFINGTADPKTNTCRAGDIYCSQLQFVTAVNISGGGSL